jgi:hypothetical protein
MTAREEAQQLRQEAIKKLLDERNAIDQELTLLGYGQEKDATKKRRGRPPKSGASPQNLDDLTQQHQEPEPPA